MKNPLQQANFSAAMSLVLFYECMACNQGDSTISSRRWADRGRHLWSFTTPAIVHNVQSLKWWLLYIPQK